MITPSKAFEKSTSGTAVSSKELVRQNRHVVRWYVLVFPSSRRGLTTGLQHELDRRSKCGETLFEYFAPSFVEAQEVNGQLVGTRRPLLYNYVFVHASESEIYRLKQRLPQYNFLPRVKDGKDEYHYPYLTDEAMQNLQWVARSYSDVIPVYAVDSTWLIKGDKVRISEGRFKDIEARVVIQPKSRKKDIMVCVENWMWVPLLRVESGQYEVIELNTDKNHLYTHLNNDRMQGNLHEALCRHHTTHTTDQDRALATETLLQYANLHLDSDVMRCKLYSLLLPAYTILDDHEKCASLTSVLRTMLPTIRAEQSRALLLVTLYGCTDSSIYYEQAHALVDPWRTATKHKKSKAQLIRQLDNYDECLGHCRNKS